MARLLKEHGYSNITVLPLDRISHYSPEEFDAILRMNMEIGTPRHLLEMDNGNPLFYNPRWLALPMFPPPWADIGGLKHFLALLYQLTQDASLCASYKIDHDTITQIAQVLPPTFSSHWTSFDDAIQALGKSFVAKGIFSSHGEQFTEDPGNITELRERYKQGEIILQKKVDCARSGRLLVIDPDGTIRVV